MKHSGCGNPENSITGPCEGGVKMIVAIIVVAVALVATIVVSEIIKKRKK